MSFSMDHPELVANPTLGEATATPFLDQVEAQRIEDFNARIEGREPLTVLAEGRYPHFMSAESVPSSTKDELTYVEAGVPVDGENSGEDEDPELFTGEDFE